MKTVIETCGNCNGKGEVQKGYITVVCGSCSGYRKVQHTK